MVEAEEHEKKRSGAGLYTISDTVATMSNAPKKIRSQPPDVTIAVGRGDAMQEFEAHKVALSFASPHFDAMLSMETKECSDGRIEFPDKDPEEWKLFYRCIDPSRMSAAKPDPIITAENAKTLIPLFREFQMDSYKEEADKILFDELRSQSKMEPIQKGAELVQVQILPHPSRLLGTPLQPMESFWNPYLNSDITTRKETFANIIESLQFACQYTLKRTKLEAERSISGLLNNMLWEDIRDLFDRPIIKVLVDLFLPLVVLTHDDIKHYDSHGESSVLWDYINGPPGKSSFEQMCLQDLSPGDINNNNMLPALVEIYIQNCFSYSTMVGAEDSTMVEAEEHEKRLFTISDEPVATMSNAPKKIRSQPPDVTIAVGRGDAMQEFEAHKVALSFASPYFDAMLSMEMKESSDGRIEFLDKDPEEWKLFYRCIDPSRMSAAKPDPIITAENAKTLIPWFHEFQMDSYKEEADKILFDELRSQSKMEPSRVTEADLVLVFKPRLGPKETPLPPMRSFWNKYVNSDITTRKETFANIIESLQFACLYGLKQTKLEAERSISGLLNYMLWETMDLFDQSIIKVLVDLFLPLKISGIKT